MVMAKKIVFEIIADSDCTIPVSYTHLILNFLFNQQPVFFYKFFVKYIFVLQILTLFSLHLIQTIALYKKLLY